MFTNDLLFDLTSERHQALLRTAETSRRSRLAVRLSFRGALGARLIRVGTALIA